MAEKLKLNNITIVAMTSVNVTKTIKAIEYSMKNIDFGDAILITHKKPFFLPKNIRYQHTSRLNNINDFNYKMVYELHKYIKTDYALIVHADGFVVNPQSWRDSFLEYDYIGAPWPIPEPNDVISYRDKDNNLYRVGNSVSIRSKLIMELPSKINLKWEKINGWYNEDGFLCVHNRKLLEKYGVKYAPVEEAAKFSRENSIPENIGIEPFCFHKWHGENAKYPKFTSIPFLKY